MEESKPAELPPPDELDDETSQPGPSSAAPPSDTQDEAGEVQPSEVDAQPLPADAQSQAADAQPPPEEEIEPPPADVRTVELLARFMLASGMPPEACKGETFKDLMEHLNQKKIIPSEQEVKRFVARGNRPRIPWHRIQGPVSVSIDLEGNLDEKMMVISIHYFESFNVRKAAVFFKKLLPNIIETTVVLRLIRAAASHAAFTTLRFQNLILPSPTIQSLFVDSHEDSKKFVVCFYHYMNEFATQLSNNVTLTSLVLTLLTYTRRIRENMLLRENFKECLIAVGSDMDLPSYQGNKWYQCYTFLAHCFEMHETFQTFHKQFGGPAYLSPNDYAYLTYFKRILHLCVKICRDVNHPDNSISSIIPVVTQLRDHISYETPPSNDGPRVPLPSQILKLWDSSFSELLNGPNQYYYQGATLLDPRYAYRAEFFTMDEWMDIEKRVISAHDTDISKKLTSEFERYRAECAENRPVLTESPMLWWASRLQTMELLSWDARDYLSCPAVSVDASFFFGKKGKFPQLATRNSNTLAMYASGQDFHGRGGFCKRIMDQMIELEKSKKMTMKKRFIVEVQEEEEKPETIESQNKLVDPRPKMAKLQ